MYYIDQEVVLMEEILQQLLWRISESPIFDRVLYISTVAGFLPDRTARRLDCSSGECSCSIVTVIAACCDAAVQPSGCSMDQTWTNTRPKQQNVWDAK